LSPTRAARPSPNPPHLRGFGREFNAGSATGGLALARCARRTARDGRSRARRRQSDNQLRRGADLVLRAVGAGRRRRAHPPAGGGRAEDSFRRACADRSVAGTRNECLALVGQHPALGRATAEESTSAIVGARPILRPTRFEPLRRPTCLNKAGGKAPRDDPQRALSRSRNSLLAGKVEAAGIEPATCAMEAARVAVV
jgi:hypothetical protein